MDRILQEGVNDYHEPRVITRENIMSSIEENLLQVKSEIAQQIAQDIAQNIELYTPNIIAVTKYFDENKIVEAYKAGLRDFGESRVIEAVEKIQKLPIEVKENSRFHLIGHLQTNKVSKAVGNFDFIHSVDSLKLAQVISEEALEKSLKQKILLQVNNADEEQKFGFSEEEIFKDFEKILDLKGIEVVGLMNMAPFGLESEKLIRLFKGIAQIKDKLEKTYNCKLKELSMGMSGDYKEAVAAGATMIRIGRKLFSQ